MVGHEIPLNQGCMNPIRLTLPKNTILNPSGEAAVVGGNVQTSQRIVDVILRAFQACAASQVVITAFLSLLTSSLDGSPPVCFVSPLATAVQARLALASSSSIC